MDYLAHLTHAIAGHPFGATAALLLINLTGLFVIELAQAGFEGARNMAASLAEFPFGTLVIAIIVGCCFYTAIIAIAGAAGWLQATVCARP